MKKKIAKFSILTLCAAAILAVPASSSAQAITNTARTAPVKKHGRRTVIRRIVVPRRFDRGGHKCDDPDDRKRTFNMTSETIVTKNDKPAVLAEGAVGESGGRHLQEKRRGQTGCGYSAFQQRRRRQGKGEIAG